MSQISLWKKQFLEAAPKVFGHGGEREAAEAETERDRLYGKIWKPQTELD